jgi:hypothetical protein
VSQLPEGIALERNRDMVGHALGPWVRRALLTCMAALPLLALLGVFGQHPSTSTAASPAASLSVTAPTRLRSGLIFQVRVEVLARREIKQLQLDFAEGWWESMSVNSIVPEPSGESSHDGQVVLSYGDLPAGKALVSGSTSRPTRPTSASAVRTSRCWTVRSSSHAYTDR